MLATSFDIFLKKSIIWKRLIFDLKNNLDSGNDVLAFTTIGFVTARSKYPKPALTKIESHHDLLLP